MLFLFKFLLSRLKVGELCVTKCCPIQLVCVKNEFSDRQAKCLDKVNACEKGNAKPVRLLWATLIKYFSVVLKGK